VKIKEMVVFVFFLPLLIATTGCMNRQEQAEGAKPKDTTVSTEERNDDVIEVSVMLQVDYTDHVNVGVHIRDKNVITDSVLTPIRKATVDSHPADYKVLGTLRLRHKDGSVSSYVLYGPWGHMSKDRKYYVADLDKLREVVKKALKSVITP
jgi:hypothetical protein